jgi:hypothetical protein
MTKPPPLSEIVAKAEERDRRKHGRGVKSPLYAWMRRHHTDLQAAIDRVGWTALTEAIAEGGVTNANGEPPPVETVRHTWWRVRRAVQRERAKAAEQPAAPRKAKPVPQVRDALPPQPSQPEPEKKPELDPDTAERVRLAKERLNKSLNR